VVCERLRYVGRNFPNAVTPVASRAILPPPCRIAAPAFVTDKMNLRGTGIPVQRALDDSTEFLGPRGADFSALRPRFLSQQILSRHLAEGAIEHRNIILKTAVDAIVVPSSALL
jgi:hypothetical protein